MSGAPRIARHFPPRRHTGLEHKGLACSSTRSMTRSERRPSPQCLQLIFEQARRLLLLHDPIDGH
jgi:hypothetical protein